MSKLHDTLSDFTYCIITGLGLSDETTAVCPNYRIETALDIYRNNYRGNLHDALSHAYPVIEQLVGKDYFRYLSRHYVDRHPSVSGNLHQYGAEMAEFIAGFESAKGLAYLPDVAELEWACHCAYFAEDAGKLDVMALAKIPQAQYADLILNTHPSCQMVRSDYPIASIWNAHQPDADGDFHVTLDGIPSHTLVSRKDHAMKISALSEPEATWLAWIRSGASLGEATDAAVNQCAAFDLHGLLLKLIDDGVLIHFTLRSTP